MKKRLYFSIKYETAKRFEYRTNLYLSHLDDVKEAVCYPVFKFGIRRSQMPLRVHVYGRARHMATYRRDRKLRSSGRDI